MSQTARVAFLTGAGSGIGRASALELCRRGYRLVVTDRHADRAAAVAAEAGDAIGFAMDVRDWDTIRAGIAQGDAWGGGIDVLVNCAGINSPYTVIDTPIELWDDVMAVNIRGMFLCSKAVLPGMIARGGGVIVNIGSASSLVAMTERAAYAASKGAVLSLTRSMAMDHVEQGIRVNCLCPGSIDTPWVDRLLESADDPEGLRAEIVARQPMKRLGTAEEIARGVAFLASDDSSFATGSALVLDGGWTAR
ncbi:MAG: SDR family oxidoreductase [Actinobacteria bacterium]|nr:SDR family oxidoreductase [Actinomycetota bacterium]